MAIKFFEKPVNTTEFGKLENFDTFKLRMYERNIYMKIPEVYVQTMDGSFPKNSILIYGDSSQYSYVCDNKVIIPVKSEIQIYE